MGSKNGGKELWGDLRWPKMAGKSQKSGDKTVQPPSVVVGHEISWPASSGGGAPHGPACVAGGWPEVPPSVQSSTARRWLNGSTWFPVWRAFS